MSLENIVLAFMIVAAAASICLMLQRGPTYPARRPDHALSSDVLPCFHEWTRHGYCSVCGEHTQAMKAARRNHPANWGGR